MGLLNIFKNKPRHTCNHIWHYVKDGYITTDPIYIEIERACYIYCPKCDKEDLVFKKEWERIRAKQEIKEKYKNNS
ncbi:hypothetical protein [Paraliobacillus ryukyuensis]|uniref:hypothetical protein n=1 Tax=Paraliobacillus ryukyuensis TaxID=200904 RepID=UPI0009A6DBF9|nr:hypothetical protein [Paraliobacillus ryukyuensis]